MRPVQTSSSETFFHLSKWKLYHGAVVLFLSILVQVICHHDSFPHSHCFFFHCFFFDIIFPSTVKGRPIMFICFQLPFSFSSYLEFTLSIIEHVVRFLFIVKPKSNGNGQRFCRADDCEGFHSGFLPNNPHDSIPINICHYNFNQTCHWVLGNPIRIWSHLK